MTGRRLQAGRGDPQTTVFFADSAAGIARSARVYCYVVPNYLRTQVYAVTMRAMKIEATNAVLRLIRAQSYLQGRFAAELGGVHGLSLNELMLLMHLDQSAGGRLRRVDLADRLDLSQSSVTRMVVPLEKTGLVTRGEDTRDARVGYVVLTRAGRRLARDGARTLADLAAAVFADRWTTQEIATLGSLLGRLTVSLPGQLEAT
jgi:DNA-binding MarR family transcriptional regulator